MNYARQCGSPARKQTPHSTGLGWPWPDHPACDHSERSSVPELLWELQSNLLYQEEKDLVRRSPFLGMELFISDRSRSFQSLYASRKNIPSAKDTDCKTKAPQSCHYLQKSHQQGRRVPSTLSSIFLRLYCASLSFIKNVLIEPREKGSAKHQVVISSVPLSNHHPTCVNDIPLLSLHRNNHRVNIVPSHSL